jgi:hypothetical protein
MRENRLSGSEGGATLIPSSLPLSIIQPLRDNKPSLLSTFSTPHHRNAGVVSDEHEHDLVAARPRCALLRLSFSILCVLTRDLGIFYF